MCVWKDKRTEGGFQSSLINLSSKFPLKPPCLKVNKTILVEEESLPEWLVFAHLVEGLTWRCRAHFVCHYSPLVPTKRLLWSESLMMLNKLHRQYPVANILLHTAGSTKTDVLDFPGSVPPMLAANFTGDCILVSPTTQMRSPLVTVCSVLTETNKRGRRSGTKWLAKGGTCHDLD